MTTRRWHYLVLILMPVVFFLLLDLGLRLAGINPYEKESLSPRLPASAGSLYEKSVLPDGREAYVCLAGGTDPRRLQPILTPKPENAFYIFVSGGSAPGGFPYSGRVAFPQWLQSGLEAVYPDLSFHVVNAALPGITINTVAAVVLEMLAYQPDAVVIYSGNNEQRNLNEGTTVFRNTDVGSRLLRLCWNLRSFQVLHYLIVGRRPSFDWKFAVAGPENKGAPRSADELPYLLEKYTAGLKEIFRITSEAHVPLVFCTVPVNEKDWPPYVSIHSQPLTEPDQARWMDDLRRAAQRLDSHRPREAGDICRRLLDQDSRYALAHFLLGKASEQMGQYEAAREAYQAALDEDGLRLRACGALNRTLLAFCRSRSIPVADCVSALRRDAANGLLGFDQFLDNCHPKPAVHRDLGREVGRALIQSGALPPPPEDWPSRFESGLARYARDMIIADQEQALACLNTAKALLEGITFRMDAEAFRRAEEMLALALDADPALCTGHFYLGIIHFLAGDPGLARKQWQAELESCPRFPDTRIALDLLDSGRLSREMLLQKSVFNLPVPEP
ncbi:MAG: tetratricopeptide repeat protein [Thermodesulfobacteriota bacterium]